MLRLIKFLFTGDWHLHEWKIIKQGVNQNFGRTAGFYYDMQCKHCGKIKCTNT